MLKRFLEFVDLHQMIRKDQKTILAVSGGVDSVVMTHLFSQAGLKFGIAHANFGLRGLESRQDQSLVTDLANSLGVAFWHKPLGAKSYASEKGISIQMAARDLRYHWLEELRSTEDFDLIAIAHHLDDSLETIIFNLAKGTGIAGLRGIRPTSGFVIRPLLFASKQEILGYAQANNLKWREDSSNLVEDYHRNRIRAQVVPLLREVNPNLTESARGTIARLVSTEQIVLKAIDRFRSRAVFTRDPDLLIKKKAIRDAAGGLVILDQILKRFGFNFKQVQDIYEQLMAAPGRIFTTTTHCLNLDREHLIISPLESKSPPAGIINQQDREHTFDRRNLELQIHESRGYQVPDNSLMASLDYDKLRFPLTLRRWQEGDRFRPLGMQGQKKISDFMIDEKIPLNLKKRLLVLISGGDIVWVVGQRIDDRYKVTDKTKRILQISSSPPK